MKSSEIQFRIGNRVDGFDEDGEPTLGRIIAFVPGDPPKARVSTLDDRVVVVLLDTCHPMPLKTIKHNKATFLAASTRISPHLRFKDSKSRRDFLEDFWDELQNFSQD